MDTTRVLRREASEIFHPVSGKLQPSNARFDAEWRDGICRLRIPSPEGVRLAGSWRGATCSRGRRAFRDDRATVPKVIPLQKLRYSPVRSERAWSGSIARRIRRSAISLAGGDISLRQNGSHSEAVPRRRTLTSRRRSHGVGDIRVSLKVTSTIAESDVCWRADDGVGAAHQNEYRGGTAEFSGVMTEA